MPWALWLGCYLYNFEHRLGAHSLAPCARLVDALVGALWAPLCGQAPNPVSVRCALWAPCARTSPAHKQTKKGFTDSLWAPCGRLMGALCSQSRKTKNTNMVPLRSYARLVGALWAPCGRLPPKTKLLNNVMRALWAPCGRLVGALCTLRACLMAALWALCARAAHALARALMRALWAPCARNCASVVVAVTMFMHAARVIRYLSCDKTLALARTLAHARARSGARSRSGACALVRVCAIARSRALARAFVHMCLGKTLCSLNFVLLEFMPVSKRVTSSWLWFLGFRMFLGCV